MPGLMALRQEFGGKGIGVSAICPGLIRTSLAANGTRAGVDDSESSAWSSKLAAGHRYIGRSPDRVAIAIERSIRWNLSTVPVGTEAWAGYYLSRLSPSAMRGLSGLASMDIADWGVSLSGKVFGGSR